MSTVIPENSFYRTDNDCIFHNDCYYNITVRSFDGTFDESILFHSKGNHVNKLEAYLQMLIRFIFMHICMNFYYKLQ